MIFMIFEQFCFATTSFLNCYIQNDNFQVEISSNATTSILQKNKLYELKIIVLKWNTKNNSNTDLISYSLPCSSLSLSLVWLCYQRLSVHLSDFHRFSYFHTEWHRFAFHQRTKWKWWKQKIGNFHQIKFLYYWKNHCPSNNLTNKQKIWEQSFIESRPHHQKNNFFSSVWYVYYICIFIEWRHFSRLRKSFREKKIIRIKCRFCENFKWKFSIFYSIFFIFKLKYLANCLFSVYFFLCEINDRNDDEFHLVVFGIFSAFFLIKCLNVSGKRLKKTRLCYV